VRRAFLLGSVAVVAAATLLVPLPLVEVAPGPTFDVPPVVSLDGHSRRPATGRLLAVTVLLTRPRAADVVGAWLNHDREIVREQRVVPPGVSEREYLRAERRVFAESAQLGAAVGLRAAGLAVDASGGGARVVAVVRGSGAQGHLRPGDVVTAANGQPIRLSADLVAATSSLPAGASIELNVLRAGQPQKVSVVLRRLGQLRRPAIGVEVVTVAPRLQLPFPVRVRVSDVGGPSAGLMVALATYELAGSADVVHGRVIAGTGTIDLNGRVGAVGGVKQKVAAARRDRASLFLAPAAEATEARRAAGGRLRVVAVRTFADALRALNG
jgi:PDZ domain-containing protein